MDKIIKNIVDIDKKAIKIKEDTEIVIRENDKKLRKKLEVIENDIISKAEKEASEEFESIVEEGKIKSDKIIQNGLNKYNQFENIYNKKKHKLQSEIFQKLFY